MASEDISNPIREPPQTTPSEPSFNEIITLQVGERRFTTTRSTLKDCTFFASVTSEMWSITAVRQADGSYFVDADGDTFAHILRYLRHPNNFPIFYDQAKGHDHALYAAVLHQAVFFGVDDLATWIKDKSYLQVVRVMRSISVVEDAHATTETTQADTQIVHFPHWTKRRVYICPRGIYSHRGHPEKCGRQCRAALGGQSSIYEVEEVLQMIKVQSTTIVDLDFSEN